MVIFEIAGQRHALSCELVVELVPLISLHSVSTGPAWLRGIFPYRGQLTPVVDLSQLLAGRPSANLLSSRIAMLRVGRQNGEAFLVGLLAEKMTQVRRLSVSRAALPAFSNSALGPLLMEEGGLLQIIDEQALLDHLKLHELGPRVSTKVAESESDRSSPGA